MKKSSIGIGVGFLVGFAIANACAADGWKAGVATVEITPQHLMPMAGYASRGATHAEGTLTELYAKALALEDAAGHRGVLVTLDLVGLERQLASDICRAVQRDHQLSRAQVVLACSHTHTGPVVATNLRPMHYLLFDAEDRRLVDEYATYLRSQVRAAVSRAITSLAPAELSSGAGEATFAVNRRNNPEAKVPELREAGALQGPVDHSVPVLVVNRGGQLAAVVFGYACHCTVLSLNQWSGDYAGYATAALEERYPGCVAMFWAGCGGDQNPIPRRTPELAQKYGQELASAVEGAINSELTPAPSALETDYAEIPLAFGTLPTREALETDSESSNPYVASRAKALLTQIDGGEPLPTTYPYPVTLWRLGDRVKWFFLGGEVVVDYALRIKAELELESSAVWVAAYAQDVMAYIPSRRVLLEGGYEGGGAMVYYGRPTVWSDQVEEQILAEVQRQARGE